MHHCMNVVTEADGTGAAVVLRALEPVVNLSNNTSGPGRLCKAMGVDRSHYGHDLCSNDFFIAGNPNGEEIKIVERPRIGVDYAGEDRKSVGSGKSVAVLVVYGGRRIIKKKKNKPENKEKTN